MKIYKVAVIGGGPSGMMASIAASSNGAETILIEKNENLGKKLLATGNGRCNLTNKEIIAERYHGENPGFVKPIFARFDQTETRKFFETLGVSLKEEDRGRIFPKSDSASTVLTALNKRLIEEEVVIKTNTLVKNISKNKYWLINLTDNEQIKAERLILATGGKAAHHLGSSGDGLFWARNLGHTITPIYAALVPIEIKGNWPEKVKGIKLVANVKAYYNNKLISQNQGDLLFTHFGLSGPAVMGIAGIIAGRVQSTSEPVRLDIDFCPESEEADLDIKMAKMFASSGAKSIIGCLSNLLPLNLVSQLLIFIQINKNQKSAEISRKDRQKIVKAFKYFPLEVKKLRPLKEAQVTRGGIKTSEINNQTLESKLLPGLYFTGEIIDIFGDSGGFNLQWAWSTGYVAGIEAAGLGATTDKNIMI